ncbi:hypothetical protein U1Q18_051646 [Sarracenia purpurea var. burkii]
MAGFSDLIALDSPSDTRSPRSSRKRPAAPSSICSLRWYGVALTGRLPQRRLSVHNNTCTCQYLANNCANQRLALSPLLDSLCETFTCLAVVPGGSQRPVSPRSLEARGTRQRREAKEEEEKKNPSVADRVLGSLYAVVFDCMNYYIEKGESLRKDTSGPPASSASRTTRSTGRSSFRSTCRSTRLMR